MANNRLNTRQKAAPRPTWKDYQADLKKASAKKRFIKTLPKYVIVVLLLPVIVYGLMDRIGTDRKPYDPPLENQTPENGTAPWGAGVIRFHKRDVRNLLGGNALLNLQNKSFDYDLNGERFRVETSLDVSLQNYILENMDRATARYIAIVTIDPSTGKIISMAGYDKSNPSGNPCVDTAFPAASIFKIVTAAAAIEKCGLNPGSKLAYNGNKHTLYKSQLKELTTRYTNRITFQDSFAQSVNPVFGKIGTLYLKKPVLETYASAFGFNREIEFELPLPSSLFSISDEPYDWAEIASGFNRTTTITPLHGALMAAALINQGKLMEPTIVDRITDGAGQPVYRSGLVKINQAVAPRTTKVLGNLMQETIRSGTCKKAFRGFSKDKTLSKLTIGGKTGSIDNTDHDARYDWFVGFAKEKDGPGEIGLSVFVAHEKYIGIRASYYARMVIQHYFKNYFAKKRDDALAGEQS